MRPIRMPECIIKRPRGGTTTGTEERISFRTAGFVVQLPVETLSGQAEI